MKRAWILVLAVASSSAFAQEKARDVVYQSAGSMSAVAWGGFDKGSGVVGAPYSATIINESVQTLTDGNRIAQASTGTTARDAQGRTRQDTVLPAIGNLSAANAPHLVFLHDPVAQTSYTLNLTEKTAQKMTVFSGLLGNVAGAAGPMVKMKFAEANGAAPPLPDALPSTLATPPAAGMFVQRQVVTEDDTQASTEDLGTQTMEGVLVDGLRTTHTIPAGQIGNERPITIVTEIWTSPDLKTVVYSKRSDPRMGEQTFRLTNIVRAEPDASLFTVPADFRIADGPQPVLYRAKQ
jgi:hypothetical protein